MITPKTKKYMGKSSIKKIDSEKIYNEMKDTDESQLLLGLIQAYEKKSDEVLSNFPTDLDVSKLKNLENDLHELYVVLRNTVRASEEKYPTFDNFVRNNDIVFYRDYFYVLYTSTIMYAIKFVESYKIAQSV